MSAADSLPFPRSEDRARVSRSESVSNTHSRLGHLLGTLGLQETPYPVSAARTWAAIWPRVVASATGPPSAPAT